MLSRIAGKIARKIIGKIADEIVAKMVGKIATPCFVKFPNIIGIFSNMPL